MTFEQQRADYAAALAWVAELMAATPSDRLTRPTPCAEFDVRTLMGHLIGTAERSLGTAEQRSTRHIPHVVTDVPDALLASTYAGLASRLAPAWRQLAGEDRVRAAWGECTALDALRGYTVETVVHGWDLAVATGQPAIAPAGIAERCLAFAGSVIPERLRGVMYDVPVPADAGANATERLAHLLGHKRPDVLGIGSTPPMPPDRLGHRGGDPGDRAWPGDGPVP